MDKIVRLIECYVPIYACNFRCHYCYIEQNPGRNFIKKVDPFPYTPEEMAYALRKQRLGGTCLINLCAGGETLLSDETVTLAKLLLQQGHYVMIVTNGTVTKRLKHLCQLDEDNKSRLWIRFSLHYLELLRLNMLDTFFENVKMVKNAGMSIAIEMVASDEYIPHIPEIQRVCMQHIGSLPEISIARSEKDFSTLTELTPEEYEKTWKAFQSPSFDFKLKTVGVKRREFCYAGDWSATLDLGTGNISKCYDKPFQNIFKDPDAPIRFEAMGCHCPLPYCHNSHIWLTLGNIPEIDLPNFAQIRDKVCADGTNWLTPQMRGFIDCKYIQTHAPYSPAKKWWVNTKAALTLRSKKATDGLLVRLRKIKRRIFQ